MPRTGDMLEVTLRDDNYNPIIKEKVNVNDKKKMAELFEQLRNKGVHFPIEWFG